MILFNTDIKSDKKSKTLVISQRFVKRKREISKPLKRQDYDYYITSFLKYIFTFKTSIIERDGLLRFLGAVPRKKVTSTGTDAVWGAFCKHPCNLASRFNIILLRAESGRQKRCFFLQDPFVEQILNHFPQWRELWTHIPENETYAVYKASRQFERFIRSSKTQMKHKGKQKIENMEIYFDMAFAQINT